MYKQGMVSILLGNIKNKSLLDGNVDVSYDEDAKRRELEFVITTR